MFNYKSRYLYEELDNNQQLRYRPPSRPFLLLLGTVLVAAVIGISILLVIANLLASERLDKTVVLSAPASRNNDQIIITISQGQLEGKRMTTRSGREYLAFLGIPYVKPPLGDLRLKLSIEPDCWNGPLNATTFKPKCIQGAGRRDNSSIGVVGSEDCLYINIFTPKKLDELKGNRGQLRRGIKLPVMTYIHGGIGGTFGSIHRNGADYLLDEDVILVTFHYRLGVLANLNTNDKFSRGNLGLKDSVMALKWIQRNIEVFGGDKNNVLLFGESYGAMSISAHLVSPMSKGLFHKAIVQSGSVLYPGLNDEDTSHNAFTLGEKLKCNAGNSSEKLLQCLRSADAKDIVLKGLEEPFSGMTFTMSIETQGSQEGNDPFLPDWPLVLYNNTAGINAMPIIWGVTSSEMMVAALAILISPNATKLINDNFSQVVIPLLKLNATAKDPVKLASQIHEFYFEDRAVSRETERNFSHMVSDRMYVHPTSVSVTFQRQSNMQAESKQRNDIYLYQFHKEVDKSYSDKILDLYDSDEFLGSGHADELQFLFPYEPFPLIPVGHKNYNFSLMMVRLWTSFAKTGKPEGADNGEKWIPINQKPYNWFFLQEEPKMITQPVASRMQFWDSLDLTELYV